jgi:hypothetical protein
MPKPEGTATSPPNGQLLCYAHFPITVSGVSTKT